MTIKVTTTMRSTHWVKMLCYGESGIGKTVMSATAPRPIIISAEQGLLSLAERDMPVIEVTTLEEVKQAYAFLKDSDDYDTICIDSISELAEKLLVEFKKETKDPRKAYGRIGDEMSEIIRKFRDIPNKHVYMIAKQARLKDEYTGKITHIPSMPGQQLPMSLPYLFDLVVCMRIGKVDKKEYRYLQTQPTPLYEAKDRSGKLNEKEEPNLTKLFDKVRGTK